MAPLPLGILASSGFAGIDSDYVLLQSETLTSDQFTLSLTNLSTAYSTDYKHLQILLSSKNTRTNAVNSPLYMQFNGVTTSTYWYSTLYWVTNTLDSSSVSSYQNKMRPAIVQSGQGGADEYDLTAIDFEDCFNNNKNRSYLSRHAIVGSAYFEIESGSGFWNTGDATSKSNLDRVDLFQEDNFKSGTVVSLYGRK